MSVLIKIQAAIKSIRGEGPGDVLTRKVKAQWFKTNRDSTIHKLSPQMTHENFVDAKNLNMEEEESRVSNYRVSNDTIHK